MKRLFKSVPVFFWLLAASPFCLSAQAEQNVPLWPGGIPENPVKYDEENIREGKVRESSPSGKNRVFSQVFLPTYDLYTPEKGKSNGVAMVICPGGGFRDVWFDREGADFAIWLSERGITSVVLKYRTFNVDAEGFNLQREVYNREVYADAKQAIHILRSQAGSLGIEPDLIGIAGYSAGGVLSLFAALEIFEEQLPLYAQYSCGTRPDFACLVYPGISDLLLKSIAAKKNIPPVFMINGGEDNVTPADRCIMLYSALREKKVPVEMHLYAKGGHGFDSGVGRGNGVASWQDSFILWLTDMKIIR